jgi:hypothetical protein
MRAPLSRLAAAERGMPVNELRQALLPGEEIIFETRKHWLAPIRDSLVLGRI